MVVTDRESRLVVHDKVRWHGRRNAFYDLGKPLLMGDLEATILKFR
jgi:hypothetical protein